MSLAPILRPILSGPIRPTLGKGVGFYFTNMAGTLVLTSQTGAQRLTSQSGRRVTING